QLFDLLSDPYELKDISEDTANAAIIEDYKNKLQEILNPNVIDKKCREDQEKIISAFGGREKFSQDIVWKTSETPVPGEYIQ
ncbi:MAG: hypothetical protein LBT33_08840, partial [Spirochaetia bacterium]|nr:hypothetical protein [Spirochaetia bacterium]